LSGLAGKYARFEVERRFLVKYLPKRIAQDQGWRITDRYIDNTRLRLRQMESLAGDETVFKLGQKEVPSPPDFSRMTITNIYLSRDEYDVFAVLPAHELRKTRHLFQDDARTVGVDLFGGRLAGLILAEIGFETSHQMDEEWPLPPWALADVSNDLRFTGGALAGLTPDEAEALLRQLSD
jgi:CYTH domain-containing protein